MTTLTELLDFSTHLTGDAELLRRALQNSPFMQRTLESDASQLPLLLESLKHPFPAEEMQAFIAAQPIADEDSLKRVLRQLRRRVMMRVIARDLGGLADLAEVVETCTVLAEVSVQEALSRLEIWQRETHGAPVDGNGEPQQMIVIGMGKLGGRELNVSSDIDLIFAYAEDGNTQGTKPVSNNEYFVRLGKKLIAAIGEVTGDGFVFRVDMRLRPYGDSGPLVCSFAMLEEYYQNQGREWERYAWIKGRVIAGPESELQALLRPFVFRKYLDYSAFGSMRELKAQIIREVNRREMQDNIKLGPGGIREIEFIAQVFQLIRGGQEREFQIRPTQQVLALLAKKELMTKESVKQLHEAYVFLRNLEHRLQYLQDAQTQMLPSDDENRTRIASGMGFAEWAGFVESLKGHRSHVQRLFDEVFSAPDTEGEVDHPLLSLWMGALSDDEAGVRLGELGYHEPAATFERIKQLRAGSKYRQLPVASRQRFDTLAPIIIEASTEFTNPDLTLARVFDLLENICRRASYLALLAEYPQALTQVARLMSASPWLASYLTQHPMLLDELLDTRNLYAAPDFPALATDLETRLLDAGEDVERKMDILRHFKHAQVFRWAAQDIAGGLVLETLSDYLSALADMVLDAVVRHAWPGLRGRHCEAPRFAVIGYGKLGGRELGYASDLDLVFLYDDESPQAGEIYARFGQRISAWLNSLTSAGLLYETDLRLRPDGASGLLVCSVAGFVEYQEHKAWTWEHQALTRARFCAGDSRIGDVFEKIRLEILCQPRDSGTLREEVIAMRQKMHEGHPNRTALFDVKHDAGGLVDVEFAVQYLVLTHALKFPAMAEDVGNIALLARAGELGLLSSELASSAANAYRELRRAQHMLRLQDESSARVAPEEYAAQRAVVQDLWRQVFGK